jgi:hypothetical protein
MPSCFQMQSRCHTSRTPRLLTILLLLLSLAGFSVARAGEEDEPDTHLRTAILEVGTLTQGVPGWLRARGPSIAAAVGDEESPLFGCELEELRYPLGEVADLIERTKRAVSPSAWETLENADILEFGSDRIVVRAPREVVLAVRNHLAEQEARLLRPITIELQARRASDAEAAAAIAENSGDLSNEAWAEILGQSHLVRAVTVTALEGQRATARSGTQRAWLATYEGVNRDNPLSADPAVRVANLGISASARALRTGEGRVRVAIDCVLAEWIESSDVKLAAELTVQMPRFARTSSSGEYLLRAGTWHVIQAPGADTDVLLLARVHDGLEEAPGEAAPTPLAPMPFLPQATNGTQPGMSLVQYDCVGLESRRLSRRVPPRALHLSNFTLPEPCELEEPAPIFPPEAIPDLLFSLLREEDWEEPATIEIRGSQLYVHNTPPVQRHIGEVLDMLRAQFTASLMLEIQVVEGALDLLDTLGLDTLGRGALDEPRRASLRQAIADGSVVHLGRQRLRSRGNLAADSTGSEARYLADYEVDRPKSGTTMARAIMGEVFSGMQVEARALPGLDGRSVRVDLDVWRSAARLHAGMAVQTPHGALQVPAMDVTHLRGTAKVLLGRTHVVGAAVDGDRVQLVLVSARWE